MRSAGTISTPQAIEDFEKILDLCAGLEGTTIPPRLRTRICRAYDRAIHKALAMSWDEMPDNAYIYRSLFRHAERGARDFIP